LFHSVLLLLIAPEAQPVQWAQLTIEQRVIIRVPMARGAERARRKAPAPPPVEWEEKKGPKCVAVRSIRSATITVPNGVDLVLADNHRYRARLERGCRSESFYSGFYVEPPDDGSLCAGRDELQARSGFACEIDSFKRLVEAD
jgi:hypothetical protein